ncbi:hypothetical protein FOH24_13820 [Acetobacter tropicalis]|uniref:Uncharacterized protein n=1 Tax=Acetobacter tropicalis TaxID=104102 RepID=A0A094ZED8_9PROT|nr:hypothetical protein [Acetobacter tropicalis]KAA8387347.1 hypothetical protein FOH24_13820 [Acetobacter tropicalis]KAA8387540.1 hypothetical protein FOH22_09475 [Acetobacter tropicalis]KGB20991.1 hypothetical protein AtDm6_3356 [Acetobacter tropicalis]MBC9010114.1 hypothetical protein [Acetobacter tropicalis]MDO8170951.1 hypothetical protein [Acetobacter tropicalis]
MTESRTYLIEATDGGFVLVEKKSGHGRPETQVPYSIEQEAESGLRAASSPAAFLVSNRKMKALDLAREITRLFIQSDRLEASALLAVRESVEDLVTVSIAEIRSQTECILPQAE